MLSQKARYAMHALLALAEHGDTTPMQIGDIADKIHAPQKFLEQILVDLKKRGILRSQRGRAGGYFLARPASEISFAEIIRVSDGPLALAPCVSATAYRRCSDCEDEKTCAIRRVLLAARDATASVLEAQTLAGALKPKPQRRPRGKS